MIEDEQLNTKRALEEDEVLNIINNSSAKKLKETSDDDVMNIIESSLNNGSNGQLNNNKANDSNNNEPNSISNNSKSNDDDDVLNIIENSINQGKNESSTTTTTVITDEQQPSTSKGSREELNKEEENTLEYETKLENLVPKAAIHKVETEDGCLHEVVSPTDVEYKPLRNFFKMEHFKPAKEYSFTIDPFQREAILCIENNESVLVSAHTSAGKTVVAEYAIALSLKNKQRVIYTTPIKALSNQKYREFYEEFKDVGLITGDVTINPTASCLIMTTEILRLMLFRGNEILREVGWVIFDEIHYMRDKERGLIWEESIILLPDNVHYVFLSATIPNARQFSEWISHLHHQICHVVYTDYRPTPLQHYIYPSGGEGLHLVVDEHGVFREANFNNAMSALMNATEDARAQGKNRGGGLKGMKSFGKKNSGSESNCFKVIRTIMEKGLAPVIVFSFSKKDCEAYALQMSKLDFNNQDEKRLVEEVFKNATDVLGEEDKLLPQVEHVLPLLKRGIGIHHSGLLPIIKETIEILFGEGLIKALFATETFAMGLNMPARTVVFTSAQKFDGRDFRFISSGEYIQMSGRAGRRGIDDRGIVILMVDDQMSPAVGKELIKGKPDPLNSAFHLTYNMVLNLLRVEDVNPEYMLQHSFYQFQHYSEIPKIVEKIATLTKEFNSIKIENEKEVKDYFNVKKQIHVLNNEFLEYIRRPEYIIPFIQAGRLVRLINNNNSDLGWAAIINFQKKKKTKEPEKIDDELYTYSIDVVVDLEKRAYLERNQWVKPKPDQDGEMRIISVGLKNITKISSVRLNIPKDLKTFDNRLSVKKSIRQVQRQFEDKVPLLDPIEDMKIKNRQFLAVVTKIETYEKRILELESIDEKSFELYKKKNKLEEEIKKHKADLRKTESLLHMDDLKCRKRVLRRLGYCTNADVIEIKGRVACEITSGDELLITEMLFNGLFNDLNPNQIAALLSCFVFEEKADQLPKLTEELSEPLRQMQELAKRIASVSKEAKLEIDEMAYIESFKPNLMDVVYAWSKGSSFSQLCKMTEVFEGSIIRCMRRLEELIRQMVQAAKVIGNTDLENKFNEADKAIKRDIVFAASLYL